MLTKFFLIFALSLNLFANEVMSSEININKIHEDIDKNNFKAMKLGFKETFKTKVEFFDWNEDKMITTTAVDKMVNSSLLYGKPETFFITYETLNNILVTYTCELTNSELKKDIDNNFVFDCFKFINKNKQPK